jgi:hypothetical protein
MRSETRSPQRSPVQRALRALPFDEVIARALRVFARVEPAFRETETHEMNDHVRTLTCGAAIAALLALSACAGRQAIASKSAGAYDEAKQTAATAPDESSTAAPVSNAAIEQTQPAATLRADEFDAPAPAAVAEAAKASSGMTEMTDDATPLPHDGQAPPPPPPPQHQHHHGSGGMS